MKEVTSSLTNFMIIRQSIYFVNKYFKLYVWIDLERFKKGFLSIRVDLAFAVKFP